MSGEQSTRLPGARPSSIGYVPGLDGLRGVAVLMVVGFHAFDWPRNGGALGVGFFFVLSGFLITSLLLKEFDEGGAVNLPHFYARRALRLFPLLYLALAAVAISVPFMASPAERAHNLGSLGYCAAYIGDLYGLVTSFPELARPTAHLWSLAVEEQFYLLWPMVLLFVLRRRGTGWLIRVMAAVIVGAVVVRIGLLAAGKTVWTLPTTHVDALLVGCGLAIMFRDGGLRRITESRWLGGTAAAVLAGSLLMPVLLQPLPGGVGYVVIEAFGGVMVLSAFSAGHVTSLLRCRPLMYCGRISYGLYVIHSLVIVFVERNVAHGDGGWRWAIVSIAATFLLAASSRRWFEGYFLRIKDKRFGTPRHAGTSVPAPAI